MIVAVTGHRPNKLGGFRIPNPIYLTVIRDLEAAILQYRPSLLITGMAIGVDQWAAEICIRNNIPFAAAVPFPGQELVWPEPAQVKYREILGQAHQVVTVSQGEYEPYKMFVRNEYMVRNCDLLIAVWDGSPGGTKSTFDFAEKSGKRIHRIIPPANLGDATARRGFAIAHTPTPPPEQPVLSRDEFLDIFGIRQTPAEPSPPPPRSSFEPELSERDRRQARRRRDRYLERLAHGESAPLPSEEEDVLKREQERRKAEAERAPYQRLVEIDEE